MTPDEIALAAALRSCSMPPGSWEKRFCRQMAERAQIKPESELSERQLHTMKLLAWRYRRQLPSKYVPDSKPPDLPPKSEMAKAVDRTVEREHKSQMILL